MAGPGGFGHDLGSAWVDVHANTDPFEREVERGVRRGATAADNDLKDTGRKFGHTIGENMGDELERSAPRVARRVERALDRESVRPRRWSRTISREIESAFSSLYRSGGPIDSLGDTVRSALGSAFNVSGRGGVIYLLLPLIGIIGALIAGLIQIINGLVALLYIIPSLLGGIILQAGVLFLAFRNVGGAILQAFSAKTPEEFEKALENLSPQAAKFVRSLMPLKVLFEDLADLAQRAFFGAFGDALATVGGAIRHVSATAVENIARALGELARSFSLFLVSPVFLHFLYGLIDSTVKWIQTFGPALDSLLTGLAMLGTAVKPFLDWFGSAFNDMIAAFGGWLADLSKDKGFLDWLNEMKGTLEATGKVLASILYFLKAFAKAVSDAGGKELLDQLTTLFIEFGKFFETDVAIRGLNTLLGLLLELSYIFVILLGGIIAALGIFSYLVEYIGKFVYNAFEGLINWIKGVIDIFKNWAIHTDLLRVVVQSFLAALIGGSDDARMAVVNAFISLKDGALENLRALRDTFLNVRDAILDGARNFGTILLQAGRNLIQGLIDGMHQKFGELGDILSLAARLVRNAWPFSPAKWGPLSGSGDLLYAGQNIVQRLAAGIEMETPALETAVNDAAGTIVFGPGSVRVGFEGAVPTQDQAQATGMAAGRGIVNAIAARNTRLQIRTM